MISSIRKTLIGGLMFVAFCSNAMAETYADLEAVVEKISQLVRDQFVEEVTANKTADEILQRYRSGYYADIESPEELERRLTDELRAISGDTHIGIVFDPESVARYKVRANAKTNEEAKTADLANKMAASDEARLDNYGIRAVEMLSGGVGYLRLDYFDGHDEEGAPAIAAAMDLLASSNAIILDLRRNGGGNSRILPLFLGYFLGPDPVHFATREERWKNSVEALYTRADIKGARHYGKPIYILTSGTTYSLAEQVTYHLKSFDRATIIGERTYGGGNGWDPVVLNDDFYLRIPRLAFVNAVTNSIFVEGEGISPDIAVPAATARKRAYVEALKNLQAEIVDDDMRSKIGWALSVAIARQNPLASAVDANAQHYTGKFDEFVFESRNDGLWLSFRDLPFVRLETLAPGLYLDDRSIQRQFQFSASENCQSKAVTVMRYGDNPIEITRSDTK